MKNEFCTYEHALALKELGFDEPCFGYWKSKNWIIQEKTRTDGYAHADQECSAPLYQQAFRWFREKHNLHSYIEGAYPWFRYYINSEDDRFEGHKHSLFEEAENACLDKLIEIVKNK